MSGDLKLPPGYRLVALDDTDSTNEEAKRLIAAGAGAPGTVVWARAQKAGKGRGERTWTSEPGNLYSSVIFAAGATPALSAQLGFVVALAARDAAAAFADASAEARCKWPNDVLLAGRKVAGVLVEAAGDAVIAGCGINVAHSPEGTEFPATSLAEAGADVTIKDVLETYLVALDHWEARWRGDGFAPIAEVWRAAGHQVGDRLSVRTPDGAVEGTFAALDDDGALVLETGGTSRRFAAGDVFLAGEMAEA